MDFPSAETELSEKMNKLASPVEDDFDNYMRKVEIIEDVLKRLGSVNPNVCDLAMKEADRLLKGNEQEINETQVRVKTSRSVINQKAFDNFNASSETGPSTMQPNEFMRQMEEDCKQRAEDRKQRKVESDRHKKEGNKAFREQRYAKAITCFDKAIDILRDSCILYCNRSLTYLKLGLPKKALKDAEMSLTVDRKSLRGYVYKAQALWEMGKPDESEVVIKEACTVLPDQKDYLEGIFEEWKISPNVNEEN